MCDPASTTLSSLAGKLVDCLVDGAKYIWRKRREEGDGADIIWERVIDALANGFPCQEYIGNPYDFDPIHWKNMARYSRNFVKSWKIANYDKNGPRYRVSLLVLGIISKGLSPDSIPSFLSVIIYESGFKMPDVVKGYSGTGRSYQRLWREKVIDQMAKDILKLPSTVYDEVLRIAKEKYDLADIDDSQYSGIERTLMSAKMVKEQDWTWVAIRRNFQLIAMGRPPPAVPEANHAPTLPESKILVPEDKKTREILWLLSKAMGVGHTLDHSQPKLCTPCKVMNNAIWHALIP